MVISKCVPLAISRKKFSDFVFPEFPEQMIFVGYKDDGNGNRKNIKMAYNVIKQNIIEAVKKEPDWGQGGSGGSVTPPGDQQPSQGVTTVKPQGIITFSVSEREFIDGVPIRKPISEGGTWDPENKTNFFDVKQHKALIEINSGGQYVEDYVYIYDPVDGAVSHIVVDNTGLPLENGDVIPPVNDFTLYYGGQGQGRNYEVITVPPYFRGIVQILHSHSMDMDFVLYAACSEVPINICGQITEYIEDEDNESNQYNVKPIDVSPDDNNVDTFYIDMAQQNGFLQFYTGQLDMYTFVFSTPELGSSTYIIVNNTGENYYGHPVLIRYGKIIDINDNGISDDEDLETIYNITHVDNEICILQIFHSLSSDIVVKITKL